MKTLINLTAETSQAELRETRTISALHYEDPECKGWFTQISLGELGLRAIAKRPGAQPAFIPLGEVLKLFRAAAPEVFASAEFKQQLKGVVLKPSDQEA